MADSPENDPADKQEPNLELPSMLGFGRKKKKSKATDADHPAPDAVQAPPAPATPPAAPPVAPAAVRSTGATRTPPPMPPPRRAPEPTASEPTLAPPAAPPASAPGPATAPRPARTPKAPKEPKAPKAAKPPKVKTPKAPKVPKVAKERDPLVLPAVDPRIAAAVTGILVGLLAVCLIIVAVRGCEAVRGVGSCGGFGLFALLAILGIEVIAGAALLKAWRFTDPTSTSFLAVGLVAVMAMLFFLDAIDSVWMFLVIPVLTALSYLLSWWISRTFVEENQPD